MNETGWCGILRIYETFSTEKFRNDYSVMDERCRILFLFGDSGKKKFVEPKPHPDNEEQMKNPCYSFFFFFTVVLS